jgi:hypothetical protein
VLRGNCSRDIAVKLKKCERIGYTAIELGRGNVVNCLIGCFLLSAGINWVVHLKLVKGYSGEIGSCMWYISLR